MTQARIGAAILTFILPTIVGLIIRDFINGLPYQLPLNETFLAILPGTNDGFFTVLKLFIYLLGSGYLSFRILTAE